MARAQAHNTGDISSAPPMPPRPSYPTDTKTPSGAPPLPARKPVASATTVETVHQPLQQVDHSGEEPPYGDAPPSYEDAMATEKLAEGIRNFTTDLEKLEEQMAKRL